MSDLGDAIAALQHRARVCDAKLEEYLREREACNSAIRILYLANGRGIEESMEALSFYKIEQTTTPTPATSVAEQPKTKKPRRRKQ